MRATDARGILSSSWANLVGYQAVWFIAVAGAGRGLAWPAVGAMLVFAAWQLSVSRSRRLDLRLAATACGFGLVIDGALAASGMLRYAAAAPALPPGGAPLWILALWMAFSLTLPRSLAWLQGRPLLGALLGAVGGPLAYLGAARGWDAVVFVPPAWLAVSCLALGWAVAVPSLSALMGWWSKDHATPEPQWRGAR